MPIASPDPSAKLGDIAAASGIRRINVLAWRDLDDPEAGGSELHIHEVARRWAAAGLKVTIRTSHAAGRAPEIVRDGYRVIRRAGRYLIFPGAILSQRVGRHGPSDALVEIWNGVPFLSPIWHRGPRLVLVHHVHADMFRMVLPRHLAIAGELFERRIAPPFYRGTMVATLAESGRRELVHDLHLHPERVAVVPPGIDARFRFDAQVAKAPEPTVLAVGRLVPVKRHDLLIEAAHAARAEVPGLRLRILGEGYERERLQALIADLDAADWVELPGRMSDADVVRAYQEAWVLASTSSREGWGMTITEAAACGTPSVATDITGHADAIDDGLSGLLCSDADVATTLARVLTDDGLRTRLSDGALQRAATLDWDSTARRLLELLAAQRTHP